MLKELDPILGPCRGKPKKIAALFVGPDDKDLEYVTRAHHYSHLAGVDDAIVYAQFFQEATEPGNMSPGTSLRWNRDNDPAGIDVPSASSVIHFTIPDGDSAAALHVQCLYSLVTRTLHPDIPLFTDIHDWLARVWLPKVTADAAPRVQVLRDLCIAYDDDGDTRATWAMDPHYAKGMLAYSAKWMPWLSSVPVLHPFPYNRPYHAVEGAVLRMFPRRDALAGAQYLTPHKRVVCKGYVYGQRIENDSRWLQTSGTLGLYIHASGIREVF